MPKPVATGGGGHWGPGDARGVGRLAACGPFGGRLGPSCSVPGRAPHGVGIGGTKVRGLGHDHEWQQIFGEIVPIQGTLDCGGYAVVKGHIYLLWLRILK